MFVEGIEFAAGHVENANICIFGSGPAGMTLANKLSQLGHDVLLVEAGGLEYTDESQALYRGKVVGDEYYNLDEARLRYLGGTSGHWAGYCRPLDAHDYDVHPKVPHTGWPISIDDVAPYIKEASEIVEIPDTYNDRAIGDDLDRTVFHQAHPLCSERNITRR